MDLRAFWETVVAVGVTPLASLILALAVAAGIYLLVRRTDRG